MADNKWIIALKKAKAYTDSVVIAGGGVPEAPSDGKQYGRKDAAWSVIDIPDVDITAVAAIVILDATSSQVTSCGLTSIAINSADAWYDLSLASFDPHDLKKGQIFVGRNSNNGPWWQAVVRTAPDAGATSLSTIVTTLQQSSGGSAVPTGMPTSTAVISYTITDLDGTNWLLQGEKGVNPNNLYRYYLIYADEVTPGNFYAEQTTARQPQMFSADPNATWSVRPRISVTGAVINNCTLMIVDASAPSLPSGSIDQATLIGYISANSLYFGDAVTLNTPIPNPPTSGTYTLQCVDGVLSWI